jgi:hypothetical protein
VVADFLHIFFGGKLKYPLVGRVEGWGWNGKRTTDKRGKQFRNAVCTRVDKNKKACAFRFSHYGNRTAERTVRGLCVE